MKSVEQVQKRKTLRNWLFAVSVLFLLIGCPMSEKTRQGWDEGGTLETLEDGNGGKYEFVSEPGPMRVANSPNARMIGGVLVLSGIALGIVALVAYSD